MEEKKMSYLVFYKYNYDNSITNVGITEDLESVKEFVAKKNSEQSKETYRFKKEYDYEEFVLGKLV